MGSVGLKGDSEKRAHAFITDALSTRVDYYVKKDGYEGAEDSESNDFSDLEGNAATVIPFWSKSFLPYARKWGETCPVQELSLEDFLKFWLTGMDKDGLIVGLNWDQNGIGYEGLPTEVLEKLK